MTDRYGYNPPGSIKNYARLRQLTIIAGVLGLIQSLVWIALTIVGILTYTCVIKIEQSLSYGSLIAHIFVDFYFGGSCNPISYDYSLMQQYPTVLDQEQLFIWVCVYLGVAVCWLLASVLLLTNVSKDNVKKTLGVIYTWIIFVLFINLMDLGLGIIFGIDYGRFNNAAYDYNLSSANAGDINPLAALLVGGNVVSISLLIISFKGFIFWIINIVLMFDLLILAVHIARDKDHHETLFTPRKNSDDNDAIPAARQPPISAYEEQKTPSQGYNNEAFIIESTSIGTIELNQQPIARAARMSTEGSLQDRRFRNLDAFQQYPPPRYNNHPELVQQESIVSVAAVSTSPLPQPDYSPPMHRANANQGSAQRNQRYQ